MGLMYRDNGGNEVPVAGLNGLSGQLVPSVSYYQTGKYTFEVGVVDTEITFQKPMPDNDYIVNIAVRSGDYEKSSFTTQNYTTTSFRLKCLPASGASAREGTVTVTWKAFKLMTDENRALDETAIAQNTSDISDLQDDKQDKTLETPLTIGGASRTTVEGALGGLNGVVPSGASASNQLVTKSKASLVGKSLTAKSIGLQKATGYTVQEFLTAFNNAGYTEATFLWSYSECPYITDGTTTVQIGGTAVVCVPYATGTRRDAIIMDCNTGHAQYFVGFTNSTTGVIRRILLNTDLTSTVTSGSNAPITSGGVYDAVVPYAQGYSLIKTPTSTATGKVTYTIPHGKTNGTVHGYIILTLSGYLDALVEFTIGRSGANKKIYSNANIYSDKAITLDTTSASPYTSFDLIASANDTIYASKVYWQNIWV